MRVHPNTSLWLFWKDSLTKHRIYRIKESKAWEAIRFYQQAWPTKKIIQVSVGIVANFSWFTRRIRCKEMICFICAWTWSRKFKMSIARTNFIPWRPRKRRPVPRLTSRTRQTISLNLTHRRWILVRWTSVEFWLELIRAVIMKSRPLTLSSWLQTLISKFAPFLRWNSSLRP